MKYPTMVALLTLSLALHGKAQASIIYGIKSEAPIGGGPSQPPANLFQFNSDGTGFTDLGSLTLSGISIDVDALAMSSAHGMLAFRVTSTGSTLISIDPTSAVATLVGTELANRDIRGATFDQLGRLWTFDAASTELVQFNPNTGSIIGTTGISLPPPGINAIGRTGSDIAYRPDGTFYLTAGTQIFTLDITNGAVVEVLNSTSELLAGAAFAQDENAGPLFVYEVIGFDDIITYDVDAATGPQTVLTNIIPTFNSGRGDLATVTQVVPGPGDFNGDLIVDGADFLKWQREDGTPASLLEWETNYGNDYALAAASAAVPEPTTCTLALAALCLAMSRRRILAR